MKKRVMLIFIACMLAGRLIAQDAGNAMPVFDSVSKEPVLLRYRMTAGKKVGLDLVFWINMKINAPSQDLEIPMTMTMRSSYSVKEVAADGNALVELIMEHISVSATNPRTGESILMDSSDPACLQKKEFRQFGYMINTPILCKISPRGTLVETDTNALTRILEQAGEAALLGEINKQFEEMMNSSFIQLSEKPVKVGDVYDAGKISQGNLAFGNITADVKYRIVSVSGDRKQVILEPLVSMSMDPKAGLAMNMKESSLKGWILFSVEKGNIITSYADLGIEIEIVQGKETASVSMEMTTKFKTDL